MGNLRSAEKALERTGARPVITSDHNTIRASDGAVLPGVGAFPKAMRNIRDLELDGLIGELSPSQHEIVDRVDHNGRRLLLLVEDLLTLSQIEFRC